MMTDNVKNKICHKINLFLYNFCFAILNYVFVMYCNWLGFPIQLVDVF